MWSPRVTAFHDATKAGHHPTLAIGADGVYHLVFYAHNASGSYTTMYAASKDRGQTWSAPAALFTNELVVIGPPKLSFDAHSILHLMWTHLGGILSDSSVGFDSYYAPLRNGEWSAVQRLFPDYEQVAAARMVVDANNVVHVLLLALDGGIYHARFE